MPEDHGPNTDHPMPTGSTPESHVLEPEHPAREHREPEQGVSDHPQAQVLSPEGEAPEELSRDEVDAEHAADGQSTEAGVESEPVAAVTEDAEPEAAEEPPPPKPNNKRWYVVKVQSGREESIKEAIERRVRKEGLEEHYGQIVIPVEKITEIKTDRAGKRVTRTKERKLYPGYLMAEVEYNDRVLYLFRETSGVGDFVGATADRDKPPPPMTEREILRMLGPTDSGDAPVVPPKPRGLDVGDRVRVADGTFQGMEGEIKEVLEAVGRVRVELTIFGRPVPVELEYYQVEQA